MWKQGGCLRTSAVLWLVNEPKLSPCGLAFALSLFGLSALLLSLITLKFLKITDFLDTKQNAARILCIIRNKHDKIS
jgi:hypothetical protein